MWSPCDKDKSEVDIAVLAVRTDLTPCWGILVHRIDDCCHYNAFEVSSMVSGRGGRGLAARGGKPWGLLPDKGYGGLYSTGTRD